MYEIRGIIPRIYLVSICIKRMVNSKDKHMVGVDKIWGRIIIWRKGSMVHILDLNVKAQLHPNTSWWKHKSGSDNKLINLEKPIDCDRIVNKLELPIPGEAKAKAMPGRLYIHIK
jgi:hypothetical protein